MELLSSVTFFRVTRGSKIKLPEWEYEVCQGNLAGITDQKQLTKNSWQLQWKSEALSNARNAVLLSGFFYTLSTGHYLETKRKDIITSQDKY